MDCDPVANVYVALTRQQCFNSAWNTVRELNVIRRSWLSNQSRVADVITYQECRVDVQHLNCEVGVAISEVDWDCGDHKG